MEKRSTSKTNGRAAYLKKMFPARKTKEEKRTGHGSDFLRALLIPDTSDLTRTGIILYLMGIFCTFLYFSQFNILSVDFLKPQAIILGVYVWFYGIAIPRTLLIIIYKFDLPISLLDKLLFPLGLLLINYFLLRVLSGFSLSLLLATAGTTIVAVLYHLQYRSFCFILQPSLYRSYIFIPLYCLICAYFFLPRIPNFIGGFKPVKVTVTTETPDLLKSRFSKSIYLLYESAGEFYFFEKRSDSATREVFNYVIKRVPRSEIKKLEIEKSIWQPF